MTWARECEHCGGPIPDHKRLDAMFCSVACRSAAYTAVVSAGRLDDKRSRPPCLHCGGPVPAERRAHAKFCGLSCTLTWHQLKHRAEHPMQTCPECNTRFKPTRDVQTWCSKSCAIKAGWRKRRARLQMTR